MIEIIVPITVLIISLIGVHSRDDGDYLSNDQGRVLKGISAVFLVIVHIRERLDVMPIAYRLLATGGFLFVSVFFFYSGFGIAKKIIKNERYIFKSLPRRILYLCGLFIGSEAVYYIFFIIIGKRFYMRDIVKSALGIKMLNGAGWTILAMIIIQTVFYICYRCGIKKLHICSIAGCVIYIIITILRGRSAWEMQSCGAFVIGALIAENEKRAEDIIKKTTLKLCVLILFIASFSIPYLLEFILQKDLVVVRVVFGTISSVSFIALLLALILRVEINNVLIRILGSISTEVYLWHGLVIAAIANFVPNYFKRTGNYVLLSYVILIIVIITAVILWRINQGIRSKVVLIRK